MGQDAQAAFQPDLWGNLRGYGSTIGASDSNRSVGLTEFQKIDWSFSDSNERRFTHALHPWAAKFIPDVPATAIALLSQPGDVVLDPFCGCGTTAVEAIAAGRGFVAADINPLAVRITEGKCEVPNSRQRRSILEWSQSLQVQSEYEDLLGLLPSIPNMDYWFDKAVGAQLAYLLSEIRSLHIATAFLETIFSSIILGVSRQESETRYRRIEREVSAEETLARFRRRLLQGLGMASTLDRFRNDELIRRYLNLDARGLTDSLPPGCVKLAVFSPPYPEGNLTRSTGRFCPISGVHQNGSRPVANLHNQRLRHL